VEMPGTFLRPGWISRLSLTVAPCALSFFWFRLPLSTRPLPCVARLGNRCLMSVNSLLVDRQKRGQHPKQPSYSIWQQGKTSFIITANTVICPLPSCMLDITITKYYFPTQITYLQLVNVKHLSKRTVQSPVYLLCKFFC
jgi:hypothetical protein